jgi:RNA polymerase sigma-70 factor (ECF subfamily)
LPPRDSTLVRRHVRDDKELAIPRLRERFQELVDRHYDGVWAYAAALTGGAAEAEDIAHQAFLAAFDRLAAGREFEGDPGAWLRATARNMVYSWWRQQRRMPQDVADRLLQVADEADDALTRAARAEVQAALGECLGKLPAADRRLVAERYEHGRRITDIARELREKAVTLRVRLFRIREALRRCVEAALGKEGVA